jgi:hypothetical protein
MNHADTIQVMGGTGHEIIGNTCRGYWDLSAGTPASLQPWSRGGSANGKYHPKYNGCNNLTICPNNALITNLKIQKNWIDGGECGMQMPAQGKGFDTGNTVDFSDNRFGVTMFPWNGLDYVQARWTTGIATFTGLGTNIFDNTVDVPSDLVGAPLVGSPGSYKVRL